MSQLSIPARFFFALLFCVLSIPSVQLAADESRPPNVVIIFIDDMGYGDVEFNGAKGPRTPNLNAMAKEGMKFTDFYVGCAVCSGSRTALLTGCHYKRLGMPGVLFPDSLQGLNPDETTIADMLKSSGYRTACIGKWHLGHLPPCLPTYQGFESYYGIPYSNDMWIDSANRLSDHLVLREGVTIEDIRAGKASKNAVPLMRDEEIIEYPCNQTTITKRYTEESIKFIKENKEAPFFLYLPHTMVHRPLAVSKAFEGRTDRPIWDAIEEVDWSVGEILNTIKSEGIENTLVIFTSDNGAAVGSSKPLRAKKSSVYDGGIREPTLMWWPEKIPADSVCKEIATSVDLLPTIANFCDAKLPEKKIDGVDIGILLTGKDAKSPREHYALMHNEGTVRKGNWKFYPWKEKAKGRDAPKGRPASPYKVQLYDLSVDIGETNNLAQQHPELCAELQSIFEKKVADIKSGTRSTTKMTRPAGSTPTKNPKKKKK